MPIVNYVTDCDGRFLTFMKLVIVSNMYLVYVSFASLCLGLVLEGRVLVLISRELVLVWVLVLKDWFWS